MDFKRLSGHTKRQAPSHPIQLFESLPSLDNTPNDLWRGQGEALTRWHENREKKDVLVSLNTGAGKTIAGVLIAQSLVNEGVENVVYVCSTIDLVNQTAAEAERIGLKCTRRTGSEFDNTLFEEGKSFCITTYAALFNGYSAIRRKHFPGAVIFDDAHVAEYMLRDAFTLRFDGAKEGPAFRAIVELFAPDFEEIGIPGQFRDSLSLERTVPALVPPGSIGRKRAQLLQIFNDFNVEDDLDKKFALAHLKDHIECCAGLFMRGKFELAPPFLPSLAMDIFERKIRRIYLSATLQSLSDFVRAFGRTPDVVIEPTNDAGNGERLILDGSKVAGGFTTAFADQLVKSKKLVVASPSYAEAEKWKAICVPPKPANFSEELDAFRKAKSGAFSLVSRADGIDLPHDTCRLMIIDGLPLGSSLIEKYQWEFLGMNNLHAFRIANRLAQLFGRINRGRKDYGAFLTEGRDLNIWLAKDRNVALLPPLLQQQILVGRDVQSGLGVTTVDAAEDAINAVLERNQDWIDYYEQEVKLGLDEAQVLRSQEADPAMVEAAEAEARFAKWMWLQDFERAWRELDVSSDSVAQFDTPIAGWQNIWQGAALELAGDQDSAMRAYGVARSRLGTNIQLPRRSSVTAAAESVEYNAFGQAVADIVCHTNGAKIGKDLAKLEGTLLQIVSGTPSQAEAAMRELGAILGLAATRPDNDVGTGPDVLWVNDTDNLAIAFELKTDKSDSSSYSKSDISQGHDHLVWIGENYPGIKCLGLIYVGPHCSVRNEANPSREMHACSPEGVHALAGAVLALLRDIADSVPLERPDRVIGVSVQDVWDITEIFGRLAEVPMEDLR